MRQLLISLRSWRRPREKYRFSVGFGGGQAKLVFFGSKRDLVEYSYKRHQHQTAATAQAPKCQTAPARLVHRLTVQNWSKDLDLLIAQTGYLIYSMYFDIKVVSEDGADELPDGSDDSTGSRIDRFEAFVCARDSVTARDIFTLYRVPRKWVSSGT